MFPYHVLQNVSLPRVHCTLYRRIGDRRHTTDHHRHHDDPGRDQGKCDAKHSQSKSTMREQRERTERGRIKATQKAPKCPQIVAKLLQVLRSSNPRFFGFSNNAHLFII